MPSNTRSGALTPGKAKPDPQTVIAERRSWGKTEVVEVMKKAVATPTGAWNAFCKLTRYAFIALLLTSFLKGLELPVCLSTLPISMAFTAFSGLPWARVISKT
jgi:hypothetical protein